MIYDGSGISYNEWIFPISTLSLSHHIPCKLLSLLFQFSSPDLLWLFHSLCFLFHSYFYKLTFFFWVTHLHFFLRFQTFVVVEADVIACDKTSGVCAAEHLSSRAMVLCESWLWYSGQCCGGFLFLILFSVCYFTDLCASNAFFFIIWFQVNMFTSFLCFFEGLWCPSLILMFYVVGL